MLHKKNLI